MDLDEKKLQGTDLDECVQVGADANKKNPHVGNSNLVS